LVRTRPKRTKPLQGLRDFTKPANFSPRCTPRFEPDENGVRLLGDGKRGLIMYIARFSYDVRPADRQQALDFIWQELKAARDSGLNGRVLIPLTRGHAGGAALQFEVELASLDQLDQFRNRGVGSSEDTRNWMREFSKILTAPPCVEILHSEELKAA
jgi:hypothetical protein